MGVVIKNLGLLCHKIKQKNSILDDVNVILEGDILFEKEEILELLEKHKYTFGKDIIKILKSDKKWK